MIQTQNQTITTDKNGRPVVGVDIATMLKILHESKNVGNVISYVEVFRRNERTAKSAAFHGEDADAGELRAFQYIGRSERVREQLNTTGAGRADANADHLHDLITVFDLAIQRKNKANLKKHNENTGDNLVLEELDGEQFKALSKLGLLEAPFRRVNLWSIVRLVYKGTVYVPVADARVIREVYNTARPEKKRSEEDLTETISTVTKAAELADTTSDEAAQEAAREQRAVLENFSEILAED